MVIIVVGRQHLDALQLGSERVGSRVASRHVQSASRSSPSRRHARSADFARPFSTDLSVFDRAPVPISPVWAGARA